MFHGETNGFPALFVKLLNSSEENKFPAYLGIKIDSKIIENLQAAYLNIEKKYAKEIFDIKTGRDKSFSHVDKNQRIDLPSTYVMIKVINQLNNIFVDLYKAFDLIAIKNKDYTLKKNPDKFYVDVVLSKVDFFMTYLLRDHKNKDAITKEVMQKLKIKFNDFLA